MKNIATILLAWHMKMRHNEARKYQDV